MLFDFKDCVGTLRRLNIAVKGIFHIGSHRCEEMDAYNQCGIPNEKIYWVDGNEELVKIQKANGVAHTYFALIDKEEKEIDFNITNNLASSSILELGTHADSYRDVHYVETCKIKSKTIETLVREENIPIQELNFWNLDIQGNELSALKSGEKFLKYVDAVYCEVNFEYVYKNCPLIHEIDAFLLMHGFVRFETRLAYQYGWGDALYVRITPRI